MLKKPGAFSLNYRSTPLPGMKQIQAHRHQSKDPNKQNKNMNATLQENQSSIPVGEDSKSSQKRNLSTKNVYKSSTQMKIQWEKNEKQLNDTISKLKKQNQRLREDAKKANKTNQENICSYQKYIKEIQTERDYCQSQFLKYKQQLKYCILWIIEVFYLNQNKSQRENLLQNKLNKSKMVQMFQKLSLTIEQLELQKHLKQLAVAEGPRQSYLILSRDSLNQKSRKQQLESIDQFNNLLDTFDLRKQSSKQSPQKQAQNIARKLFVNDDTFGHQIGDHSISHDFNQSKNNNQYENIFSISQKQSGVVVRIKQAYDNNCQDYLKVKKGDEVKLLKKVGSLWIAESGTKIGYITEDSFN